MINYVQALTTVESLDDGVALARTISEARLAACVQIVGPVRSIYWWHGTLEDSQEWQLLIKTTMGMFPALEAHIKEHHPYETPEIIAMPIVAGSAEYLSWINAETRQGGAS